MIVNRCRRPARGILRVLLISGGLTVLCGIYAVSDAARAAAQTPPAPPAGQSGSPSGSEQESQDEHGRSRGGGMRKFMQACEGDIKKLCSTVKPGGGRIVQCLEEHSKEVSPDCGRLLEKHEQRRQR